MAINFQSNSFIYWYFNSLNFTEKIIIDFIKFIANLTYLYFIGNLYFN